MIILDTNIVSEFMGPQPEPAVHTWLNAQTTTQLYLTSISIAEILFGLAILGATQRRERLQRQLSEFLRMGFANRILDFDGAAASRYGEIRAHRRALGTPISALDAQIAAIANQQNAELATRNIKDFVDCGLKVVDPFRT